ncbi:30S ribosomal protein S17 [Patescibacteria group bacterium]|nr:30S ribosomal protein S17 [Patescibacteria group bacterium]MCL5797250.1 30S ribosomal protein S17 [Patescibacteria group bacterium]
MKAEKETTRKHKITKTLKGKVVSNKMTRTIVVEVGRQRVHPLYKKIMRRSKRYKVEGDEKSVNIGDMVKIGAVRPISKEKHFQLIGKVGK